MRSRFDEQLALLNKELITMGALCETAIGLAIKALTDRNQAVRVQVKELDKEIDQMERDIETLCLKLILQQQPVASDLRQISAALKMVTDMERIGDQAEEIAEIAFFFNTHIDMQPVDIDTMAKVAGRMVTDSVDAYVRKDKKLIDQVIRADDEVDQCFNNVKKELITMIAENPDEGEYAVDLLMTAKYFERIGDHAVNIAEWVSFSMTGDIQKHN